jgi:hypothetical protein
MSTGQTILTIASFLFLTTILTNFYTLVASTGDDIANGQDGILETTISTSYLELAQGMSFDEVTDSSDAAIANATLLTLPANLGPDCSAEDSIQNFNDFDDFNGLRVEKQPGGTNKRFMTRFAVHYVDPNNVTTISAARTFVKRLDLATWRSFPPASRGERLDTLHTSLVFGYFHFD